MTRAVANAARRIAGGAAGDLPISVSRHALAWACLGAGILVFAVVLAGISHQFASGIDSAGMPILQVTALLAGAGASFALAVPWIVAQSESCSIQRQHTFLLVMIAAGLLARLVLFFSEPVLENDYRRYLWDGAVLAGGHNPYAQSPRAVIKSGDNGELAPLSRDAGETLQRIGHKGLTTIYPPVAQAAFGLAHIIAPWSLNAWRAVLLAGDLAALVLLVTLLGALGRSPLWAALYWLNPVVLKEGFNSAHLEPVLVPLVLLAVLLVWRGRLMPGTLVLGLAAGVKLWPVLLAPLLWRHFLKDRRRLLPAVLLLGALMALWCAPLLLQGPIESSGLAAYAESWSTNSALYPAWESMVATGLAFAGAGTLDPAYPARAAIALLLVAIVVRVSHRPWTRLDDLLSRSGLIVTALLLLSPAQYPWYLIWALPFLVFSRSPTLLAATATIPLYYTLFYFAARDQSDTFTNVMVWLIWIPVWAAAAWEMRSLVRRDERIGGHNAQ